MRAQAQRYNQSAAIPHTGKGGTHTSHKWRNQRNLSLRTSHCLSKPKQQRQITMNTFLFQRPSSLDTLPSRSDLDQDTFFLDADLFVESDKLPSFLFCSFGIEGEAGVDFG
jgi:hypothetical protein